MRARREFARPVVARVHRHRDQPEPRRRSRASCRRRPTPAASTGDWRVKKRYAIQGYLAAAPCAAMPRRLPSCRRATSTAFSGRIRRARARPDADVAERLRRRWLGLNKIAGERVRFSSNVSMKTPGFDINDVGFLRRADTRNMSNWLQWRNERPSKYLRSFRFNLNQWAGWNFDGDLLNSGGNVNAHATFTNNWATGMGVQRQRAAVRRPRHARRARALIATRNEACGRTSTRDGRKPASVNVFGFLGNDARGLDQLGHQPGGRLPADVVPLGQRRPRLRPNNDQRSQWVENTATGTTCSAASIRRRSR